MSATAYIEEILNLVEKIKSEQLENIKSAAELLVKAVINDKSIFSFGASHSFILTEELVYRTGGLMLINPIIPHGMNLTVRPMTLTSKIEQMLDYGKVLLDHSSAVEGDIIIIASTSGRNPVVIDMASAAINKGISVIGITSIDYTKGVTSRHPSGKKLNDLCDITIDNCAPYGDAVVNIPGFAQNVSPASTVTGCVIVNAIVAEVVRLLIEKGIKPPVFISANLDHGDAYNKTLLNENKHRIHYME